MAPAPSFVAAVPSRILARVDDASRQGRGRPTGVVARGACAADSDLTAAWERAWARTDQILALIVDPELSPAPLADQPPLLFHLGHGASALGALLPSAPAEHAELDDLFGRPLFDERPSGQRRWPRRDLVQAWVEATRDAVRAQLADAPLEPETRRAHEAALDHESLHQEHLLGLLRFLPGGAKRVPAGLPAPSFATAATRRAVGIPAGAIPAGVLGARGVSVPAFVIDSTPTMNGELFEFLSAGGYEQPRFWDRDDWAWRQRVGLRHPTSWRRVGPDWMLRGVFEDLPLARVFDWPASVTLPEARAFGRWRGRRLPREAELLRVLHGGPDGRWCRYPWGDEPPDTTRLNADLVRWRPCPVGSHAGGASAAGVHDLLGNGWEWVEPEPPRTDGQGLLLGASWASPLRVVQRALRREVPGRACGLLVKFRTVREDP